MAAGLHGRSRAGFALWLVACLVVALVASVFVIVRRGDEPLLTVDGWELNRAEFLDQLGQVAANETYVAARSANGQPFRVFRAGSTTEYDPAFVVEFLNERVTFRLAETEVARRGLAVTADDRTRAVQVIEAGLPPLGSNQAVAKATTPGPAPSAPAALAASGGTAVPGTTPGTAPGRSVLDGFGSYRQVLVDGVTSLQVLQRALTADLTTDDGLRQLYERSKDRYANQACVRHLLVDAGPPRADAQGRPATPSDAEYAAALVRAEELRVRLAQGADFAALASAESDDPSSKARGGDLGCAPKGTYTDAFDTAVWTQPIGQVGAPVKTEYGYHLILVTERRERTFEELRDTLRQAVVDEGNQALQRWLEQTTKAAQVTVDPAVGRWNPSTGLVEPPGGRASLGLVPGSGTTSSVPAPPGPSPAPIAPSSVGVGR